LEIAVGGNPGFHSRGIEARMRSRWHCPQCWKFQLPSAFLKRDGGFGRFCQTCRKRYAGWSNLTTAQKLARAPRRSDPRPRGRVHFVRRSHNKKTGSIPVSMSERGTCPPTCSLYQAGCYAGYGKNGSHWKRVGERGLTWRKFLAAVRALPEGTLWRHNEAGDLAGQGQELDGEALAQLVEANRGRRGFTYTHKTGAANHELLQWANLEGLTINLSADTLEEADALFQHDAGEEGVWPSDDLTKAGPVVVLLPEDAPDEGVHTPAGRHVVVCPAQTKGLTCKQCELCAHPFRRSIIGFRAHGQSKALIPEIVRSRRGIEAAR
jgi:hypothetical protein